LSQSGFAIKSKTFV